MKIVTDERMRELDRRTIEEAGVPGNELMDRAGRGIADVVMSLTRTSGGSEAAVCLMAGRGNNGGDVFAAARHLHAEGVRAKVWLAGSEKDIRGDAFWHLAKMKEAQIPFTEVPTKDDWEALQFDREGDIIVDGILGTGVRGPARGPAAGAIQAINALSSDRLVVSVDVPSGLHAGTGAAMGDTVRADVTVTMGLPKTGLAAPEALDYVGSIEVIDIGIPEEYVRETPADMELITAGDLRPLFGRRSGGAHKGTFGHALIIGGSSAYSGAIIMAARAAIRSGAGLVSVVVPRSLFPVIAGHVPEVMVHGVAETGAGSLAFSFLDTWSARLPEFDAVLVGPGMTTHAESQAIVRRCLHECQGPLLLDADALNVMQRDIARLHAARGRVLITPHPGEMGRLMNRQVKEVQAARLSAALEAARLSGAVVALKGAGTLVCAENAIPWINLSGNPGMATAGMGDVLAGIMVGLLAQGLATFDAARAAVYLHGHAGDNIAWRTSQNGLIASDVIDEIPYAFRELTMR